MLRNVSDFVGHGAEFIAQVGIVRVHRAGIAGSSVGVGVLAQGVGVERDGSITDVKVMRSVDPSLDREAQRVVRAMPRWKPGKQNGSAVRVKYTVPVVFRLQ